CKFIASYTIQQYAFRFTQVSIIRNTNIKPSSSCPKLSVICDITIGELTIRDNHKLILGRHKSCIKDINHFYRTIHTCRGRNLIANPKRFKQKDQYASRKVGQRALQGHTNCQTSSTDYSNKGRSLNP